MSEIEIEDALNRREYKRRIARLTPTLTVERKREGLELTERHFSWSMRECFKVFLTDEKRVIDCLHLTTCITRKITTEILKVCYIFVKNLIVMRYV